MVSYNTLVVLIGTGLLGANAGLIGSFAVLRGRSLLGDALAHAALPGLCLAFLLTELRSLPVLLVGALGSGLLGVGLVAFLVRRTRTRDDAAIGLVLSVFFAAGLVLSGWIQRMALAGNKAGLDHYILGQAAGMLLVDCLLIGVVSAVCALAVLAAFKEFQLVVFDADLARSQGWPVGWIDLGMMGLVAVTVVVGLPAVGVVLMSALLIIPAAAARMWTDSLARLVLLAAGFGALSGMGGTLASSQLDHLPTGPAIVLTAAGVFCLSLVAAPRRGLIGRAWAARSFVRHLERRLLLVRLFEQYGQPGAPINDRDRDRDRLTEPQRHRALQRGWLAEGGSSQAATLTPAGHAAAVRAVREHRVWQELIATYPVEAADLMAHSAESPATVLAPDLFAELTQRLRDAGRWPEADCLSEPGGAA